MRVYLIWVILSILVAEAVVMRQGVYKAIQSEYQDIIVEEDNKIFIQAVQGEISVLWIIHFEIFRFF